MTETADATKSLRPPPGWRRIEFAPLGWIGIGLFALLVELIGMKAIPPSAGEDGRAVWVIGAALLHATAILVGTLSTVTLPRHRDTVRRLVSRLSVAIFGAATLASHGWTLWVIFARVHAPETGWLRLDPIVNVVGGLYLTFGWLAFLVLLSAAAWIARFVGGPNRSI